jgi:hypothetical protein
VTPLLPVPIFTQYTPLDLLGECRCRVKSRERADQGLTGEAWAQIQQASETKWKGDFYWVYSNRMRVPFRAQISEVDSSSVSHDSLRKPGPPSRSVLLTTELEGNTRRLNFTTRRANS